MGGLRDETLNSTDYVPILLQNTPVPIVTSYLVNVAQYPGNGNSGSRTDNTNMYMFIPAFRIVKGNGMSSIARPLRAADTEANMLLPRGKANPP